MKHKKYLALCMIAVALMSTACNKANENVLTAEKTESSDLPSGVLFDNSEMKFTVPDEYKDLVTVDTSKENVLFSVTENESVEAAKKQGSFAPGVGWLFDFAKISAEEAHQKMTADMSGCDIIAVDNDGNYYVSYHPTDVRMVRDDYNDKESTERWSKLCQWASTDAIKSFIDENGLTEKTVGNSDVEISLYSILYGAEKNYTLSTLQYGPLEPKDVNGEQYIEKLTTSVKYEYADSSETPDGEYVVLNFPDKKERYDFFFAQGKENYIRKVYGDDESEVLFKATFEDETVKASEIMQQWYDMIAKANGK